MSLKYVKKHTMARNYPQPTRQVRIQGMKEILVPVELAAIIRAQDWSVCSYKA